MKKILKNYVDEIAQKRGCSNKHFLFGRQCLHKRKGALKPFLQTISFCSPRAYKQPALHGFTRNIKDFHIFFSKQFIGISNITAYNKLIFMNTYTHVSVEHITYAAKHFFAGKIFSAFYQFNYSCGKFFIVRHTDIFIKVMD